MDKPEQISLRETSSLPAPRENEVKLRILYGGICGSDLRVYKGSIAYASYPVRPGHEALGVVLEAGENTAVVPGQKAVIFPNTFCGHCSLCLQGKTNVCRSKQVFGINAPGVFGSEFITEGRFVVPVPAELPDERAVLVEPLAVTVHALKKADIKPGMPVAVVGTGTEGLLAIALANHLGAEITAIDVKPEKLALARELGARRTAQPQEVAGETFPVVIEAAGVRQSIEQAMQLVEPGGCLVGIGITGEPVNYPVIHIVRNEITIFGTIIYTLSDFDEAIGYLNNPAFHISPVLSKIVPVADYQQAYEDALSGKFVKIVLDFKGEHDERPGC